MKSNKNFCIFPFNFLLKWATHIFYYLFFYFIYFYEVYLFIFCCCYCYCLSSAALWSYRWNEKINGRNKWLEKQTQIVINFYWIGNNNYLIISGWYNTTVTSLEILWTHFICHIAHFIIANDPRYFCNKYNKWEQQIFIMW